MHDKYSYRVIWSEEDQEYVGLVAEFPSLSWMSKSQETAFKGIRNLPKKIVQNDKNNEFIWWYIDNKVYECYFKNIKYVNTYGVRIYEQVKSKR